MAQPKRVVAAVTDLFFAIKVNDVLKRFAMDMKMAKSAEDVLEKLKTPTALVIVDLNDRGMVAMDVVRALKGDPQWAGIPVLAFSSHVQVELMNEAKAAGVEAVVARSVFAERLPELIAGLALQA
jgi:CheY-like chemotaxis protein